MSPLLVISLDVFSKSVGCLFTFLMMLFDEQMFLISTQSNYWSFYLCLLECHGDGLLSSRSFIVLPGGSMVYLELMF